MGSFQRLRSAEYYRNGHHFAVKYHRTSDGAEAYVSFDSVVSGDSQRAAVSVEEAAKLRGDFLNGNLSSLPNGKGALV